MANEVINNNEKLNKLLADKEFMLGVLKKKSPEEVQKAFTDQGVKFEKKDVDMLGKALGDISAAIDKCSPEEVNKMANLFETVDPSKLGRVVGGFGPADVERIMGVQPNKAIRKDLEEFFNNDVFYKDGKMTEAGERVWEKMEANDANLAAARGKLIDKGLSFFNGSKSGPTKPSPLSSPSLGGGSNNGTKGGGSNKGLLIGGGVALAVAALGVAYMCRDKISGWFGK